MRRLAHLIRLSGAMVLPVTAVLSGSVLAAASVPKPGDNSFLDGVFCASASDCWAVGYYTFQAGSGQVSLNQVLHWNGQKWSKISTPNPGGMASNAFSDLAAVRCTSGTSCWAVGAYAKNGTGLNQVLHWSGRRWSVVAAPTPGGGTSHGSSSLSSVSCSSAADCWAVGSHEINNGGGRVILNQALHWNGTKWSVVSVPSPAGTTTDSDSELNSVRCASARDCWAAGFAGSDSAFTWSNQVLHWNGRQWSVFAIPSPGGTAIGDFSFLNGLSCTSATNCWVAGTYGTFRQPGTRLNQALHWNGHSWSLVSTPEPDGTGQGASNQLHDVSCTSPSDCWAVGNYGRISDGGVGGVLTQALHWDGGVWSLVPSPNPSGTSDAANNLAGIRCSTASDCWAVGDRAKSGGADVNLVMQWNGRRWANG